MHILKAALAVAAALALAACSPGAKWTEHAYPDWGVAASFPTAPVVKPLAGSAGGALARGFTAEAAGVAGDFTLAAFDASGSAKGDDQILADTVAALSQGGSVTSQTYVATGKVVGRDVLIARPGQATMRVRIYVANHRLYEIAALSPRGPKDPAVERFLDSLRLL